MQASGVFDFGPDHLGLAQTGRGIKNQQQGARRQRERTKRDVRQTKQSEANCT